MLNEISESESDVMKCDEMKCETKPECIVYSRNTDPTNITFTCTVGTQSIMSQHIHRRVSRGGGPKGPGPPPLEIEKQQKKRSSEQILSYFTYICYFFSLKYHFLS